MYQNKETHKQLRAITIFPITLAKDMETKMIHNLNQGIIFQNKAYLNH